MGTIIWTKIEECIYAVQLCLTQNNVYRIKLGNLVKVQQFSSSPHCQCNVFNRCYVCHCNATNVAFYLMCLHKHSIRINNTFNNKCLCDPDQRKTSQNWAMQNLWYVYTFNYRLTGPRF